MFLDNNNTISGSTGTPKGVPFSDKLLRDIVRRTLNLNDPYVAAKICIYCVIRLFDFISIFGELFKYEICAFSICIRWENWIGFRLLATF